MGLAMVTIFGLAVIAVAGSGALIAESYVMPRIKHRSQGDQATLVASFHGGLWLVSYTVFDNVTVENVSPTNHGLSVEYRYPGAVSNKTVVGNVAESTVTVEFARATYLFNGRLGFAWLRDDTAAQNSRSVRMPGTRIRVLVVPYWPFLAAGLISGLLAGRPLLRARCQRMRQLAGKCIICGFDLRASTARCPECGTPILQAPARTSTD